MNDVQSLSEEALLEIVRRHENSDVPGSLYNRARTELELRDRKKINAKPSVSIHVGGSNQGVISAAGLDSTVTINQIGLDESIMALKEAIGRLAPEEKRLELTQLTDQIKQEASQPSLRQKALATAGVLLTKTSEIAGIASFVLEIINKLSGK